MAGTVMCPPFFVRFLLLIPQLMTPHKIIVLYGRGNLGKTRTLRMVIDKLNGESISNAKYDTQTICHYNDKTIAVATKGDNAAELCANVSYFNSHPCDIAITAARSRGGTHDVIKSYAQETGAEVVWIYKRAEAGDENAVNLKWAERVVEEVKNVSKFVPVDENR